MAEASIPVDLLNPGQVFACIGFVEVADKILGEAEGAFDWTADETRFHLRAAGDENPIVRVLRFLDEAEARAVAVEGSPNHEAWKDSWGAAPIVRSRNEGYPFPDPSSPATLVCMLHDETHHVLLDHWGDETRDNVKFWGGMGGMPGTVITNRTLDKSRGQAVVHAADPFNFGVPQSSSFRLDWRRDYIPLDAGFSLNQHGHIEPRGYPIVELLAAIGLSNARPTRGANKLEYVYSIIGRNVACLELWLSPMILRAGLSGQMLLPFPMRRFRIKLNHPDKHSRVITGVMEET